jgi:hypothetical protein
MIERQGDGLLRERDRFIIIKWERTYINSYPPDVLQNYKIRKLRNLLIDYDKMTIIIKIDGLASRCRWQTNARLDVKTLS